MDFLLKAYTRYLELTYLHSKFYSKQVLNVLDTLEVWFFERSKSNNFTDINLYQ